MKTLFLVTLFLFSACKTHVTLQPPPPRDAPFEQRLKAYKELRPVTMTQYMGTGTYGDTMLALGNGMVVSYAEDLLPVVGENTTFFNYVQRSKKRQELGSWLLYTGAIVSLIGTGMLLSHVGTYKYNSSGMGTLGWSGLGLAIGGLGVEIGGIFIGFSGREDEQAAFSMYESALQNRLGVDSNLNIQDAK
jgi:hypothetical protein